MLARIGSGRPEIHLNRGRALLGVAKEPQRPFVVKAGDRTITALGTLFDVDVSPTELRVTLAEGVVAVRPVRSGAGPAQQILKPRQQLVAAAGAASRSEEHTSELQSLMRSSYAVFCLKKKK